jgi:hypothetical protein
MLEIEGPEKVAALLTLDPKPEEEDAWADVVVCRQLGLEVSFCDWLDDSEEASIADCLAGAGVVVEEMSDFALNPPLEVIKGGYWLKKGKPGRSFVLQLNSSFIMSSPISPISSINVVNSS